jgi:UDP-N-acetyl-D-mannosaminuronic acid transferase (WecB/TagA/CpsF family)
MYKNLKNILKTLTLSNNNDTAEAITHTYKNKGFCIVHFLYFATIVLNKLDIKILPENGNIFTQSLISGDFLLPDGIALQVLYRKYFKQEIPNLNGTDFLSYFLSNLSKNKNVEIYLYGGTNDVA